MNDAGRDKSLIVVGGGVIGLASAWRLASRGIPVTLLERREVGAGASGIPWAALWPSAATKRGPGHLAHRASLWRFESFVREVEAASGHPVDFHRPGRIEILGSEDRRRAVLAESRSACAEWPSFDGEPVQRWISPEEVGQLEPNLRPAEHGALLCLASAFVRTPDLLAALRSACIRRGVVIDEQTETTDLWIDDGRVLGVVSDRPRRAEGVLVAAGAWTPMIANELAESAPVHPVKGQVILLRPPAPLFRHLIKQGRTYLIPTSTGEVLIGSTSDVDAGFDDQPTPEATSHLHESAASVVPALADAELVGTWVGHRPQTVSGEPHLGPVAGVRGLYVAAGHFKIGVAMAPWVADRVGELLATSQ